MRGGETVNDYHKTVREKRKAQGICTVCGKKESENGKTLCIDCKNKRGEYEKKYLKERRDYLKERGFCIKCGKERAMINSIYCDCCYEKAEKYNQKYFENHRQQIYQRNKLRLRALRADRAANGLCKECGKKLDNPSFKRCTYCRVKEAEYKRLKANGDLSIPKRDLYKLQGLCVQCGGERYKGFKVCRKCYDQAVKASSSRTTIRCEYWAKLNKAHFTAKAIIAI